MGMGDAGAGFISGSFAPRNRPCALADAKALDVQEGVKKSLSF